jgi:hypothetical protein
MNKKYLDIEGLQYLWSRINMQDYPNNKTLIAVINAIDDSKADRQELDNYLLKSDYTGSGSLSSEDWTFTLVDGTIVTKKVAVK